MFHVLFAEFLLLISVFKLVFQVTTFGYRCFGFNTVDERLLLGKRVQQSKNFPYY